MSPGPAPDFRPLSEEGDRGVHMGLRVRRTAEEAGLAEDVGAWLQDVHRLAMEPRRRALPDERNPIFLHPGRTALILLGDAGARDPGLLAASLVLDTLHPRLQPADGAVARGAGESVLEWRNAVPRPGRPDLVEALVTADEGVALLALAEWLDHVRHLHLDPDMETRRERHRRTVEVYLPVAERTHPQLARRYRWWCGMFGRRWLS